MFEERRCVIGRLAVAGRAAARPGGRAPQRSFVSRGLPVDPARSATPVPRRDADRSQNPCGWFPRRARPGGGGAARRAHCTEARHGTVRTHPLQVCLASPHEAPIRSVYGRHPSRLATVGPHADVRDVTGEVGQQEAGKEWTAKRYTAVRRWVGACGMVRGLSGATAPGRRRRRARWRGGRRVGVLALGAAHGGVCVTRWPGLAAHRLHRSFAAPVRAGFERMRRGHGFAMQ